MFNKKILCVAGLSFLSMVIYADDRETQPDAVLKLELKDSVKSTGSIADLKISQGKNSEFFTDNGTGSINSSMAIAPKNENDGTGAIGIENNPKLNFKDFTISCWIKLSNTGFEGNGVCLFDKFDNASGRGVHVCFSFNTENKMRYFLKVNNNSNFTPYFSEPIKSGANAEWFFSALTFANGHACSYFGGVNKDFIETAPVKITDIKDIDLSNTAKAFIGFRASTGNRAFSGNIADFRIYDKALSAAEIKTIKDEAFMRRTSSVAKKLPVVLFIGDSIRMGYAPLVKAQLANKITAKWPDENCEDSGKILSNIEKYIETSKPDLIYINCGLHDIKSTKTDNKNNVPIEIYEENLNKIINLIKSKNIKVVWALTTPVIDEWHNNVQGFNRFNADVVKYNKIAKKVMLSQGVGMVDHYQIISEADKETVFKKDGVHYTDKGSELFANTVSIEIIKALNH